ncbi:hypothetical protein J3A83DRAFT_4196580 [Scleroderma citrinum]
MTLLHAYFNLRDQQAFQRLIERDRSSLSGATAGPSTSVGKSSPGRSWFRMSLSTASEVNTFDQLGRTVLHLACSSTDTASTEYARMFLAHPNINVNIPDKENHWTALHRAMYAGHIEAANAALGLGDGNDHAFPDYVVLPKKDGQSTRSQDVEITHKWVFCASNPEERTRGNLRLCGFGSEGHAGEVISWGLNRFCQLGYVVESGQAGSTNEPVQTTPRKITHLKKEFVKGVAACVDIGYEWWTACKTATPVQIYPRQVSVITQPVYGIAMTETAMVCLFKTGDVVCLWHGGVSKINFPAHSFPSEMSVYRPPQAVRGTAITKLVAMVLLSCAHNLVMYTSALGNSRQARQLVEVNPSGSSVSPIFKEQLRCAQITPVLSERYTLITSPPPLHVVGNSMEADMAAIAPYIRDGGSKLCANVATTHVTSTEDDIEDAMILNDIETLKNLMNELDVQLRSGPADEGTPVQAAHGANITIRVGKGMDVPAQTHSCLTLQASPSWLTISFRASTTSSPFLGYLLVAEVSPLSLLVLLHYLYSDDLLALWDRRIGVVFADQFNDFGISSAQVKAELTTLVGILELRQLSQVLRSVVKRVPVSTTREDYQQLFDQAQGTSPPTSRKDTCVDVLAPDVALHLNDKVIYTHSVILRARCPFFSAFFGDLDWTVHRRDCFGVVDVQMGHLTFRFRHQGVWRHPPCLLSLAMTCYGLLWVWGIPWSIKQPIATTSKRQTDPSWQNRSLLP